MWLPPWSPWSRLDTAFNVLNLRGCIPFFFYCGATGHRSSDFPLKANNTEGCNNSVVDEAATAATKNNLGRYGLWMLVNNRKQKQGLSKKKKGHLKDHMEGRDKTSNNMFAALHDIHENTTDPTPQNMGGINSKSEQGEMEGKDHAKEKSSAPESSINKKTFSFFCAGS